MNTCYYYLIVEPLSEEYKDDASTKPAAWLSVKKETKEYTVSFFAEQNRLCMIRIEIPNIPDEVIPESDLETIQIIKEHVLSILRLTYDHTVTLFPRPLWTFTQEGQRPSFNVEIRKTTNPHFHPFIDNIRNVFVTTFPTRVQMRLLSDSQDGRLPLQYRYLSLYKLLEMEYKEKGKWTKEYREFVNRYEIEFKKLGILKKPANFIHELRDRCAHIKTGKEAYGVTELSRNDMIEVEKVLPLMTNICTNLLNQKYREKGFSLVNWQTFTEEMRDRYLPQ